MGELLDVDDPVEFVKLPIEQKVVLLEWIGATYKVAKTPWRIYTSYGLKHVFERSARGFYVTNGQFKGAMLAVGHNPVKSHEKNWTFRIRQRDSRARL